MAHSIPVNRLLYEANFVAYNLNVMCRRILTYTVSILGVWTYVQICRRQILLCRVSNSSWTYLILQ